MKDEFSNTIENSFTNFTYEDFIKNLEKIFAYIAEGPKLATCTLCGDTVKLTLESNCSCGNIGDVIKIFKESDTKPL